ncbi:hypothetical protein TraAM80_08491 [Trypanosoma rangeli]|uniref:Uncharacterized protein n=1 Tax=Trypanosoma rangeli TaxID=5698 RepID=A0A3R7MA55_TRYRA|nr:uncharacterized protein TraAM80_08491 [Trypanosoma rangeli]RNE98940.1 hypothetical protein TraAM80_08491 [Trypanosoma rangeli]|eukprot:RNE98940.1 hypothetical protein TraAM80_08491 [Trypanosoma rangeli]
MLSGHGKAALRQAPHTHAYLSLRVCDSRKAEIDREEGVHLPECLPRSGRGVKPKLEGAVVFDEGWIMPGRECDDGCWVFSGSCFFFFSVPCCLCAAAYLCLLLSCQLHKMPVRCSLTCHRSRVGGLRPFLVAAPILTDCASRMGTCLHFASLSFTLGSPSPAQCKRIIQAKPPIDLFKTPQDTPSK